VIHPSVPARSMKDFVAYVRANPGKLAYGSFGRSAQFWTEELLLRLGLSIRHVPYKIEAWADLVSGEIQLLVGSGTGKPLIDSEKLVALATSGTRRWEFFPQLPTYGETGLEELKDYSYSPWLGFAAASGIPDHVAAKLHEVLVKALHTPAVQSGLARRGVEIVGSTMLELEAEIRSELERNRRVLASGRIKLE
ncbi:MAG: Bug family tripartite tricarboxylate transporter substrate binding protein, partial [Gammaproteobacteria bacterium]